MSVLGVPNSAADLWLFWRSLLPFLTFICGTLLDGEMYKHKVAFQVFSCMAVSHFPVRLCHFPLYGRAAFSYGRVTFSRTYDRKYKLEFHA